MERISTNGTQIKDEQVPKLVEILAKYAVFWNKIGNQLGFSDHELDRQTKSDPVRCLQAMLYNWVQWTPKTSHKKYATLEDLVKALRSDAVGLGVVAEECLKEFKSDISDEKPTSVLHGSTKAIPNQFTELTSESTLQQDQSHEKVSYSVTRKRPTPNLVPPTTKKPKSENEFRVSSIPANSQLNESIILPCDLNQVFKAIYEAKNKWYNLGLELGLHSIELDDIREKYTANDEECLRDMLKQWLSNLNSRRTWKAIIDALKVKTVGHYCLAEELAEKYLHTMSTSSTNTPSTASSVVANTSTLSIPLNREPVQHTEVHCQLQYLGEKYNILEPVPNDLLCQKCSQLPCDPQQMTCCHRLYCSSCVPKQVTKRQVMLCSNTNHIECLYFPDGRSKEAIVKLKIQCVNNEAGCTWQGELQHVTEHRSECQYEVIPCTFSEVGCSETVCRCDLADHVNQNTDKHLECATKTIASILETCNKLKQEIALCQRYCCPPLNLRIHDQELEYHLRFGKTWYTDYFYTYQGYKVQIAFASVKTFSVAPKKQHPELLICLFRVQENDMSLPVPRKGKATVTILKECRTQHQCRTIAKVQPFSFNFTIDKESDVGDIRNWRKVPTECFPHCNCYEDQCTQHPFKCVRQASSMLPNDLFIRVDKLEFNH